MGGLGCPALSVSGEGGSGPWDPTLSGQPRRKSGQGVWVRSGSLGVWGAKSQGAASLGRCPCGVAEGRMEAPLMLVLAWAVPKALLGVRASRGGERGLHGGLGWDLAVGGTPPNLLPDSSVTTAESTVLGGGRWLGRGHQQLQRGSRPRTRGRGPGHRAQAPGGPRAILPGGGLPVTDHRGPGAARSQARGQEGASRFHGVCGPPGSSPGRACRDIWLPTRPSPARWARPPSALSALF